MVQTSVKKLIIWPLLQKTYGFWLVSDLWLLTGCIVEHYMIFQEILLICKQESLPKLGKCFFTENNFQYCKHPSFFSSVNSLFGGSFLSKNFSHLLNLKFLAATSQRKNMVSGMKKPEYMPECNQSRLRT